MACLSRELKGSAGSRGIGRRLNPSFLELKKSNVDREAEESYKDGERDGACKGDVAFLAPLR